MTPERMAALVAAWVRRYTRGLPEPVARRRAEEIGADLHDHIAHERARGTSERRIALGIASRMLRGLAADASWRRGARGPGRPAHRRIALATAGLLLVPLVAMQLTDSIDWGVFDFVFAGLLLGGAGLLLEHAVRKPRTLAFRAAAVALGVAAIAFGEADDAPGLVAFGLLLIAVTVVQATVHSHRARS